MKLLGCCQHSPLYVQTMIQQAYKIRKKQCSIFLLPVEGKVRKREAVESDVILIPNYSDFLANMEDLNHRRFEGKVVVLFASVLRLNELAPVNVLDNTSIVDCSFKLSPLTLHKVDAAVFSSDESGKQVYQPKKDFLATLIEDSHKGSLLSPFMTLIYQLSTSMQSTVKLKVFTWMVTQETVKQLRKQFSAFRKLPVEIGKPLMKLLESDVTKEYREAVHYVLARRLVKKPVSYKAVCKKFKVSRFEIKYILHVLGEETKYSANKNKTLNQMYYDRPRNSSLRKKQNGK